MPPGKTREGELSVFVDPGANRVVGARRDTAGLMNTLAYLHFELLAGRTGRILNGVGAALLLFLSVSGILLWWPGRKLWRRSLVVDKKARVTRLHWDVHNAGGFYASLFLLALSLTGVYFCFEFVRPMISVLTGGHANDLIAVLQPSLSTASPHTSDASVNAMFADATGRCPACTLRFVQLPTAAAHPVRLLLNSAGGGERSGHYIWDDYDRYDGHLLRHLDTATAPFGVRLMLFFGPLHFGTWAGQYSKIAWVILGLSPGVLFVSGFLMWWRRAGRRWLPRKQCVPAVRAMAAVAN